MRPAVLAMRSNMPSEIPSIKIALSEKNNSEYFLDIPKYDEDKAFQ